MISGTTHMHSAHGELTGEKALAQVFLFGEQRSDLAVTKIGESEKGALEIGGAAEPTTTSDQERDAKKIEFSSWSSAELAYGKSRYLFIVNSANEKAEFTVSGWPGCSKAADAFTDEVVSLETKEMKLELPAYGVKAFKFSVLQ